MGRLKTKLALELDTKGSPKAREGQTSQDGWVTSSMADHVRLLRSQAESSVSKEGYSAIADPNRSANVELSDTEGNIIEALGQNKLTGEKIAKKVGYTFNSNFKSTLSSLRKRGILGNASPGYFVTDKFRGLLDKGQDKCQD